MRKCKARRRRTTTRSNRMHAISKQITAELAILIGQPLSECGRAADMHFFGFGPLQRSTNRQGEEIESSQIRLHIQSRWRLVGPAGILFGRDDLHRPADEALAESEFDWDQHESVLDAKQRNWVSEHSESPPKVVGVSGNRYGDLRIELEFGFALETFCCDSNRSDYSEQWRLFGHRADGSHFVVSGQSVA
jgi:hypothetical protein